MTPPLVAITGASGYLGSRLVRDSLPAEATRAIVRKRVPYLRSDRQVEADLLDEPAALARHFEGAHAVVHLAGHNEVVAASEPDRALAETALGTRHVAVAAAAAGVARIVYVSTIHVYGAQMAPGAMLDESVAPEPVSTYATARLASEHLLAEAAGKGIEVVVLRLSNAVGAPVDAAVDRWSLVANDLCRQAVTAGTLTLRTPGLQWRDFVSLTDVCEIVAACTRPGDVAPGTYNLGSGEPMTVRGLAELIQDRFEARTGRRPPLEAPAPESPAPEPFHYVVDRLAAEGFKAATPLAASVDELVAFCEEHEAELS